jgi:hypothetical protein
VKRLQNDIRTRSRDRAQRDVRGSISDWDLVRFSGQLSHQIWYEFLALDSDYTWNKTNLNGGLRPLGRWDI